MNAQEAIEVVEQLDVFHEKNIEAIEALSIVLESAKYLHEELINKECTEHFSTQKVLYLNTDLEESKVISNGQSKKIGIEEGADE